MLDLTLRGQLKNSARFRCYYKTQLAGGEPKRAVNAEADAGGQSRGED